MQNFSQNLQKSVVLTSSESVLIVKTLENIEQFDKTCTECQLPGHTRRTCPTSKNLYKKLDQIYGQDYAELTN